MTASRSWRRFLLEATWGNRYVRGVAMVTLAVVAALPFRSRLKPIDVIMGLLLAVVLVSARWGRGPALVAIVLAILSFDFYFVPPYGTLSVLDGSYWFTFGVMFLVALLMTNLTATIREQAMEARRGEQRALALYRMLRDLARAADLEQQRQVVGPYLGRVVDGEGEIVFAHPPAAAGGRSEWIPAGALGDLEVRAVADWSLRHRKPAGWGTNRAASSDAVVVPLRSDDHDVGVAVVRPRSLDRVLEPHELETLELLGRQAAVVLDQAHGREAPWRVALS